MASVLLVSLLSFVGVAAFMVRRERLNKALFILVSLAAGGLFGDALIHLLPEAFGDSENTLKTSLWVLAGIFGFFVLEKLLRWRHRHTLHDGEAPLHVGYMNLSADALHNLIDGVLIGASYMASPSVGMATTLAVILHEIPQEIGDFGILLHAGFSRGKALFFNFLSSVAAILGAVLAIGFGEGLNFTGALLPFTAGGFLYIAGSDIVPELQKESIPLKSFVQLLAMGAGVGLMVLLLRLE